LNILVPVSSKLRDFLYIDGSRHKIYITDTSKVFLFDRYKSWCLKRGSKPFSFSSFHVKTHGWVKRAHVRDGMCTHCHLSENVVKKVDRDGIDTLEEDEKQNYLLYLVHKVFVVMLVFFFIFV
jgi:hypothetical protein